jgi:PhnB protein
MIKAIPDGYNSVTPYLIVDDGVRAIDFYKQAFGATEVMRMPAPDGKIGHAELQFGDSKIMLADEMETGPWKSAKSLGSTCVTIMLYVQDVDAVFKQALAAGATEVRPVKNQFYGDRMGAVIDPFKHVWNIGTHVEDVSQEEMGRRAAKLTASGDWE